MIHVPCSHVHDNITFYYVHVTSYIVGGGGAGISITICSKFYVLEKYETGRCINSMQAISYTRIYGRSTVIGGYKCGVINNRPVITENSISNKNKNNRNNNNTDIQVDNGEIHLPPSSIGLTKQILLEQTRELVLELEMLKFDISLLNRM